MTKKKELEVLETEELDDIEPTDEELAEIEVTEEPVEETEESNEAKEEGNENIPSEAPEGFLKPEVAIPVSVINRVLEGFYTSPQRLKAAGYDPATVYDAVKTILADVRTGRYGTGVLMFRRLRAMGLDAVLVRRALLKQK